MPTSPVLGPAAADGRISWAVLIAVIAALLIGAAGCDGGARDLALDPDLARSSVRSFLDAWQRGGTADELNAADPQIVAGDPDFKAGKSLVAYRVLPEETDDGTNLHVSVELELKDGARVRKKRVTYVVGTSPVVTIFPR